MNQNNMKYKTDFLIVGAGITGCTLANRIANECPHKKVLIIDKNDFIGGNCFDVKDPNTGIYIQRFGPHIFHTNNERVWNYLSRFTDWHVYHHRVLGHIDGNFVPIPFNLNTLYELFSPTIAKEIEIWLLKEWKYGQKITLGDIYKHTYEESGAERIFDGYNFTGLLLYNYIKEKIFENYTEKMWGMSIDQIDDSVINRVPIVLSRDNRYFQDKYQGIPEKGYTEMFKRMLVHDNITIELNMSWEDIKNNVEYDKMIFTGPIDEFFEYEFGELQYRTIRFEIETLGISEFQSVATVNYPNEYDFTRITEFKHFNPLVKKTSGTIICKEYPKKYEKNIGEIPMYPVQTRNGQNQMILRKYQEKAEKLNRIHFAGRLGGYKYINMDQAVSDALMLSDDLIDAVRRS